MLYAAIRSMGRKKEKTINLTELEPEEKLKYEIAEELGLLDRVMQDGWKSLTSKETGRIGGMVTGRSVVIVGNIGLVNTMIDNEDEQKRYTSFALRLREMERR